MKRTLQPLKGLGDIKFGAPLSKIQDLVGVHQSKSTNPVLKEEKVYAGATTYAFMKGKLAYIELDYQSDIYFNEVDLFNAKDVDGLLKGYKVESAKDHRHIKELGLILIKFGLKNVKKREVICYSRQQSEWFEFFLDVI